MDSNCTTHPTQAYVLFCLEDKVRLCLKCVAKHAGHTILDFEDVCTQHVMPLVELLREESRLRVEHLKAEIDGLAKAKESFTDECAISLGKRERHAEEVILAV